MVGKEEEPKSQVQQMKDDMNEAFNECCPGLTWTQRITGFIILAAIGYLITFGSFARLGKCLHGNCVPFACMYSFGNLIALGATCFLVGPTKQCKLMFKENRQIASIVFLAAITAPLLLALIPGIPPQYR